MSHRGTGRSSGDGLSDMMAMMFGESYNSFQEFALHHVLTMMALTALFLPLLGPFMDHHFAERQPLHTHIYPDGSAYGHLHSYETYNHHLLTSEDGYDEQEQIGAVVILTDSQGLGSGPTGTPAYLRTAATLMLAHEGDSNRFAFSGGSVFAKDATIPAPKQPPRI